MGGEPGRDPIRVLLVDDEETYRETLAKVLRRRGMDVTTAGSGSDAVERLPGAGPEVVVLDLRMPGLDGLDTLREIRRREPAARVIILTGHGTPEAGLAAIRGEACDFLLKPVVVDRLVEVIESAAAEARRSGGR